MTRHPVPPESRALVPDRTTSEERGWVAERIAEILDVPMTILGLVFLVVVAIETFWSPDGAAGTVVAFAGWGIWALFAAEFLIRMIVAPSTATFLKRNWWQVFFLVLPFLRALRLLRIFRLARAGRVVSSAIRTTRSASKTLTTRLAWLGVVHLVVVVATAQLIVEYTPVDSPGFALYLSARGAVSGEPFGLDTGVARAIETFLATYAIVIFASLASAFGAFLLEKGSTRDV